MKQSFTPAAGISLLTPLYDSGVRLLTREKKWREQLVAIISPQKSDRILDVGCGTATLALKIAQACPGVEIHGIDPDPKILEFASKKIDAASQDVSLHQGFVNCHSTSSLGKFTKIVSSLVLHQTPIEEKKNILSSMAQLLEPGGSCYIADYGQQRSALMRALFRSTIQVLDGVRDTQANADGCIPTLMEEAGFELIKEVYVIPTVTGSISIYSGTMPN